MSSPARNTGDVGHKATISIRGVTKQFESTDGTVKAALGETNVEIDAGQFVSVVGPSGCGKSTLMLITAGLLEPSHGQVDIGGKRLTEPLTDVGIAFQDHLLMEYRTAMENVLLQQRVRKLDAAKYRRRAEELFGQLGIADAAGRYPSQLSGGMRQRVAIVRALVHSPSTLLMDEPFGALDALTRLQVRRDLESLWMLERPTVLFITHSVEEAVGLSDRVLVMSPSPGEVVEDMAIDLPRPRKIGLQESDTLDVYVKRIYAHFERLGVLSEAGHSRH